MLCLPLWTAFVQYWNQVDDPKVVIKFAIYFTLDSPLGDFEI